MPEGQSIAQWQDLFWAGYYRMADLAIDIREKGKIDINFGSAPVTRIATSEETETEHRQLMAYLKKNGYYEYEWLGPDDLKTIFPGIDPKVRGGLSTPQFQVEPFKYTLGLAQAAEKMGAEVKNGDVIGFDTKGDRIGSVKLASGENIEADVVVIAMGPWSGKAASWLGKEIPVHVTLDECLRVKVPEGFPLHSIYGDVNIISRVDGDLILAFAEYTSAQHFFDAAKRRRFTLIH
jgi:glycine/D-amino acid oxidase-like deaminating enzyme